MNRDVPEPSGVRRIFANLGLLLGGKAGAGVMSLVYLVIAARTLGATDYGTLILIHAYVTLIGGVIAFSGWHGVVRYGNIAYEAGDHGRFLRLVRFMSLVEVGCGLVAILVSALLVPFVGPHFEWPPVAMALAVPYALAILANVRSTPHGILQIAGRFDLISLHQLVSPTVRLVGSVTAWLSGGGLVAFLIVWLLASVAEGLSMWAFGWWGMRQLKLTEPLLGGVRGTVAENEGLLPFIVTTNVDLTLGELGPKLAPLTVGWLLGPAAAGIFSLAQRGSVVLQQPAVMLGQASYAVIAKLLAAGDIRGFRNAVVHSAMVALAIGAPITLLLGAFGNEFLRLLGGKSFSGEGAALLLFLVAAGRLLALGATSLSSALIALGQPSRSITANLLGNLGLYPLLPLMLWWLGLDGAGWHALLQSVLVVGVLAWFFRRALLPLEPKLA